VIVGASLAGVRTAQALRRGGHRGPLVLAGAEPGLPYDRPPLSKQLLTGARDAASLALVGAEQLGELDIELVAGTATGFDPAGRTVRFDSGREERYDALVVATGSRPRPRPPALDRPGVFELRTLADAEAIRRELRLAPAVAVVGAGFIGTEVAAAARHHRLPVTLVDLAPDPLRRQLGATAADAVLELHRDRGVAVRLGRRIDRVPGTGRVGTLELDDGSTVHADLVVVGVGVRPATGWLAGHGVSVEGGVPCTATGRAPWDGVWAVGDATAWRTPQGADAPAAEHWTSAVEQAAVVAHNLLRVPGEWRTHQPVGYVWTDQYEHTVQRVGWAGPDDADVLLAGSVPGRRFVSVAVRDGRVVAGTAFGFPAALPRLRAAVRAGSGVDGLRGELAGPGAPASPAGATAMR
jgi:3-phenylpropionate/trans-cinnamate dioxygenase ferredoxin reductase subunit